MNTQAVALKKSNFEIELDNYEGQIAAALPQHISVDKFKRVLMTAIARDPALYMEADRRSLFNAAIQCATDGLVPDGREAALVIFNTKDRKTQAWVKAVAYIPMVHGIRKKMRNTGEVASAEAHCVFQNDAFDYALGDESYITHKPTLGDRGAMIGAYAIIKLVNGEVLREVMSRAEIEKVRAVSKSKDSGPWVSWFDEQARKTVLKRCSKAAPMSSDLERLMGRGDEPEPLAAIAPPPRPTRASIATPVTEFAEAEPIDPAAAGHENLDDKFRATVEHDETTGEIAETSAPSGVSSTPPLAEVTEAPAEAEGQQDADYDAAAVKDMLWQGALDQRTVPELDEYWGAQEPVWKALHKNDRPVFAKLLNDMNVRRAVLGGAS